MDAYKIGTCFCGKSFPYPEGFNKEDDGTLSCPDCGAEPDNTTEICYTCDDEVRKYDGRCSCDWCDKCNENINAGNCDCEEEEEEEEE